MPLFGSKKQAPAQTVTTTTTHKQPSPTRSSGLFSRNKNNTATSPNGRHTTTTTHHNTTTSPNRNSSILGKSSGGGLLHRNHEDSSISSARERVMRAETAEREADKALVAARAAVREAHAEVKRLEHEAAEEVSYPNSSVSTLTNTKARHVSRRSSRVKLHRFPSVAICSEGMETRCPCLFLFAVSISMYHYSLSARSWSLFVFSEAKGHGYLGAYSARSYTPHHGDDSFSARQKLE